MYAIAGDDKSVYQSNDDGSTWTLTRGMISRATDLAMDPLDPSALYASTDRGIYKTINAANDWVRLRSSPPYIERLIIDPADPSIMYAKAYTRLYATRDAGASWSVVSVPVQSHFAALAIAPTSPPTVYIASEDRTIKSIDGGNRWMDVSDSFPHDVVSLTVDPSSTTTLFAGTRTGLFKTIDAGATWNQAGNGLGSRPRILSMTVDPAAPEIVLAATANGEYRSADGGDDWERMEGLPTPQSVFDLRFIADPEDADRIYAAGASGIYRSTDQGRSWDSLAAGLPGIPMTQIEVSRSDPEVIYACCGQAYYGPSAGHVFRSSDGGDRWQTLPMASGTLALDPNNPDRLYSGGKFSEDGGRSWEPGLLGAIKVEDAGFVAVSPSEPRIVLLEIPDSSNSGSWSDLYLSLDRGVHWVALPISPVAFFSVAFDPTDSSTIYANGQGGLFTTTDKGKDWSLTGSTPESSDILSFAIDPLAPSTLYAAVGRVGRSLFRSFDGGRTWTKINKGLLNASITALAIDPARLGYLYAALNRQGVFATSDGGYDWRSISQGLPEGALVESLAMNGSGTVLYAATSEGIFATAPVP